MTRSPSRCTPLIRFGPLMSSRAISRTFICALLVPDGVPEPPLAVVELPEVRRAEPVGEMFDVRAVDERLLEDGAGGGKLIRRDADVAVEVLGEALRKLAVEAAHECHAFVTRDVSRANLLCRVVRGAADPELDVGREVVEVVDPVVDGVVLRVGAGRSLGRDLEVAVLDGEVVGTLRMPPQVVAEVVHLDSDSLQ